LLTPAIARGLKQGRHVCRQRPGPRRIMDTPRCFWAPRSCHLCGAQQQPEHRSVFAHSGKACDWAPKRSNDFMMQCARSPTEDFDGIPADHSPVKPATQCRLAHKAKHKVKGGRKVASECKQGRAKAPSSRLLNLLGRLNSLSLTWRPPEPSASLRPCVFCRGGPLH
jgi:hypothetical protein